MIDFWRTCTVATRWEREAFESYAGAERREGFVDSTREGIEDVRGSTKWLSVIRTMVALLLGIRKNLQSFSAWREFFVSCNLYLELSTPPVIKVPDFSWKFLWFFLYKNLQLVYPPLWPGGFHENP